MSLQEDVAKRNLMTVKQLIEELQKYPGNLPVVRQAGKHDYWREDVWSVEKVNLDSENEVFYEEYYEEEEECDKPETYVAICIS